MCPPHRWMCDHENLCSQCSDALDIICPVVHQSIKIIQNMNILKNYDILIKARLLMKIWSCQVTEDGGTWTIKTSTTLKTMELKFKVGGNHLNVFSFFLWMSQPRQINHEFACLVSCYFDCKKAQRVMNSPVISWLTLAGDFGQICWLDPLMSAEDQHSIHFALSHLIFWMLVNEITFSDAA